MAEIKFIDAKSIKRHEQFLIKQFLQISFQDELISGELTNFPAKHIIYPKDYLDSLENDKPITDPNGELKISLNGELNLMDNSKTFLFNCFQLPNHNDKKYFVLIRDLINSLNYDNNMKEEAFLNKFNKLLKPVKANLDEIAFLKKNKVLSNNLASESEIFYTTTRLAFITFGAAIITCGVRIVDDYWENLAKEQRFTTHHRVFKYSKELLTLAKLLKPTYFINHSKNEPLHSKIQNDTSEFNFVQPYTIITEQPSQAVRYEYGQKFAKGQHVNSVVPGQAINGSLELSAQFKLPKYHSKNSFLQAIQIKGMDVPIGKHQELLNTESNVSTPTNDSNPTIQNFTTINHEKNNTMNKPVSRMVSSLMDSSINSTIRDKRAEENNIFPSKTVSNTSIPSLNINGWKFESLPIKNDQSIEDHSIRGLPLYNRNLLFQRLQYLTPNQIKEVEHIHDSLYVNVGLQRVRKIRDTKWKKYWQYKNGLPIGLLNDPNQLDYFKEKYLQKIIEQEEINTVYNEATNTDEVSTTKRIPNSNYLNNSNIKSFKPPYA